MKPKKFRTEIWFQPGPQNKPENPKNIGDREVQNRLRLVSATSARFYADYDKSKHDQEFNGAGDGRGLSCCWSAWEVSNTLEKQLQDMHQFDYEQGFPKAIYIGHFYEEN